MPTKVIKKTSYIDLLKVQKSLQLYDYNNFVSYLHTIFDKETVNQLCKRYKIGTSKYRKGATVFWLIDENNKILSGKVMYYNKVSGKRSKNKINWVHSILKLQNFNLKQCLFGLHQIPVFPNKIIGIVESEKTAIIMTGLGLTYAIMNDYIWLATGGLKMLKIDNLQVVKTKKIVLYPDLGNNFEEGTPFMQWKKKAEEMKKMGFNITVSSLLEENATELQRIDGEDIADFVIRELENRTTFKSELSEDDEAYGLLINKNPQLLSLVKKLDLVNPVTMQPYKLH